MTKLAASKIAEKFKKEKIDGLFPSALQLWYRI